ncbi:MAG: hypothetical protein K2P94_05845, partial [Rhodospirillaceae bacterium]|nr:hypothetical protein [Rhodospirillaceae bacterium]
ATPVDLDVDRVRIEDGTLAFQDVAHGAAVTLRGIDATLIAPVGAATSLRGSLTTGGVPLDFEASLGRALGGAQSLAVAVKLAETDAGAKFSGSLQATGDVQGDFTISAASGVSVLDAVGVVPPAARFPEALHKPVALTIRVRGNSRAATGDITILDVGGTPAKGALTWQAGEPSKLDIKVEFGAVNVESWRFAALAPTPGGSFGFIAPARAAETPAPVFASFKTVAVGLDVRMPVLAYRGQAFRGSVAAALHNGALTISDATLEMPGATHVRAFGIVQLDEAPVFEGVAELQSANLRDMLTWLGMKVEVPSGRLSSASLRAAVQGTPTRFTLADITAVVDTSTTMGRVSWASAPRPTFGVDLTINALNVDAYIMPAPTSVGGAAPVVTDNKPGAYGVTPKFTGFTGLADFDADVRLQVDSLTAGGVANGKLGLDASLKDGALKVRSASIENVAGATAWISGGMSGFGIAPLFDDVQFDLSVTDIARLGRILGWQPPEALRGLAPLSIMGVVHGGFAQADIAATVKAAGLTVHADGKALTLDQQPHLTFTVEATQASYAALMKAAGRPWPLGTPDPGAVKISARVTHETAAIKVEAVSVRVGDNVFAGDLQIARGGGQPEVTGALTAVALSVDRLWPKATAVSMAARGDARPVNLMARGGVWSGEPFDWSALTGWRGNIAISGPALTVRGLQVQDFETRLIVGDGVAELADWKGRVFGAPGQIYLRAAATPSPLVQGELAFIGGDLAGISTAVNGGSGGLKSGGKADFAGSFRMQGASPADMAADISGSGTVKIAATEAGTGPISALLGAVAAANQLEGLSGQKGGTVTLESRFSAAQGKIKIEDATVASKSYGGAFTGTIDLPRWQVDMTGRLRLEAANAGARPASVPIAVKGALDLPNITLLPN